jgi:hypothetical protein
VHLCTGIAAHARPGVSAISTSVCYGDPWQCPRTCAWHRVGDSTLQPQPAHVQLKLTSVRVVINAP